MLACSGPLDLLVEVAQEPDAELHQQCGADLPGPRQWLFSSPIVTCRPFLKFTRRNCIMSSYLCSLTVISLVS